MKKLSVLFVAVLFTAISVVPAMAGPSRAIIQEMGSVIGKDEVNVDMDWVSQGLDVTGTDDATVGGGDATLGMIGLSSVNVGLAEGFELRLGRLPGLRSYLVLPVGSPTDLGVTLKGAIPGVSGLAAYLGYGSSNEENIAGVKAESSNVALGVAYTWSGPVIVNANLDYNSSAGASGAAKDTTTALAAAVLYPLKSNVIVGGELHYATIDTKDNPGGDVKLTVLVPALGARVIAGNFTIDAIAVLAGTNVDTDVANTSAATATVIGVPTLRVNYKF